MAMTISEQNLMAKTFARFELNYIPEPNSGCWIWLGYIRANLFGLERGEMSFRGRSQLASRISYELFKGDIPLETPQVLHTCDNSLCVNPDQLYLGTHTDNMRDMRIRGRSLMATQPERCSAILRAAQTKNIGHTRWCGEHHWKSSLTWTDIDKIRSDPRSNDSEIVREYGVYPSTIRSIRVGKTWKRGRA